jgi:putative Holliday junction resolvase
MAGSGEKVLAVDYGQARTGLAVSDSTGILARPLEVVHATDCGDVRDRVLEVAAKEQVSEIVVGMPYTLRGERGEQAQVTDQFVRTLGSGTDLNVTTFDERFTTKLAARAPSRRKRGAEKTPDDAVAAAQLLADYLRWKNDRDV